MREPLLSIVMPVYNGGEYLLDAVASILEQSFRDWELICVNDGSSDGSGDLLDWFASEDPRVRVHHQANAGIVAALNAGCSLAIAPLIGRMDCDDVALPNRFALQTAFMRDHPNCVVVGGAILQMDAEAAPLSIDRLPDQHDAIVTDLLNRRTGHFHPTTLFRASAFQATSGYRSQYQWVEDHDLWLRMSRRGELRNIQNVVLCYRQHASSVCWKRCEQQRQLMNDLLTDAYRVRGQQVPESLLLDTAATRSPAGSGKWARAAAKGGFVRSASKHLRKLLASPCSTSYKVRMTAEVILRSLSGAMLGSSGRLLRRQSVPSVPQFPIWHQRWTNHIALHRKLDRRVA